MSLSNFGVRVPIVSNPVNRAPHAQVVKVGAGRVITDAVAEISTSDLLNHTVHIHATGSRTYRLPPASEILSLFGKNIDSGAAKLTAGSSLVFEVVNHSASTGAIVLCATAGDGGDSSNVEVAAYTAPRTRNAGVVHLEFTNVSGSTGSYTIY